MESKLYVGNLSYNTTEEEIRTLFSAAGKVESVDLIKDRETGMSKGFAFVTMSTDAEAQAAIQQVNGQSIDNREIRVSIARPREDRAPGGGGFRSGPRSGNSRGGGPRGDQRGGGRDRRDSGGGGKRY